MSFWSKQFLKTQWDALIALAYGIVVMGLSLLGRIDGEDVAKWTLGLLALVAFTIVNDRQARSSVFKEAGKIEERLTAIEENQRLASELEAVPPDAIGRWFAEGWADTTRWRFKGGTGTYLRAQTLPGLVFGQQRTVEVWAEILAPDDEKVCRTYSEYRSRTPGLSASANGPDTWDTRKVRIESYATIVAAIWYSQHTTVTVHVALTPIMSTIRHDLCDRFVIVTNELSTSRALAFKGIGRGGFFGSARRELEFSFAQAEPLVLQGISLRRHEISGDDVREALRAVHGLKDDDKFLTGTVCAEIALKAISKEHATRLQVASGGAVDPYPANRG